MAYLRSTLISFSSESSLPFKAFLSIILTAYIWPGLSLLSANLTTEKAPLKKKQIEVRVMSTDAKQKPTCQVTPSSNICHQLKVVYLSLSHLFWFSSLYQTEAFLGISLIFFELLT